MASPSFSPLALPHNKEYLAKRQDEEAKTGYSPLATTLLTGAIAGLMVWLLPLALLLINLLLGLLSGVRGAGFGRQLLPLVTSPVSLFWLLFIAISGAGFALARRLSARGGHYWYIPWEKSGTLRFGLDDLCAFTLGTFFLWWMLLRSGAGRLMYWLLLSPAPGLLLLSLWQIFYAPIIRRLGRISHRDHLKMIMTGLRSDPHLRRACGALRYTFDHHQGILDIHITTATASAEDSLRQLLNLLDVGKLGVKQINIIAQDPLTNDPIP